MFIFFFFQAEDGIRDRSPSRGLGDVYKRQFYDRYLLSFTKRDTVMAVGVGYDFQLLSSMTFEDEYDVPLDGVITDKREVFVDE